MRKRILTVLLATALNIVSVILISLTTNLQITGYILSGIGLVLIIIEIKATSKNAWWNY